MNWSLEVRLCRLLSQHIVDRLIEPRHACNIRVAGVLVEPENGSPQRAELVKHLGRGESMVNPPLGMEDWLGEVPIKAGLIPTTSVLVAADAGQRNQKRCRPPVMRRFL